MINFRNTEFDNDLMVFIADNNRVKNAADNFVLRVSPNTQFHTTNDLREGYFFAHRMGWSERKLEWCVDELSIMGVFMTPKSLLEVAQAFDRQEGVLL